MPTANDDRTKHARRRFHVRRPTWRGWFSLVVILGLALVLTLWALDYGTLRNRVARNVTVENVAIGRLDNPSLRAALDRADSQYGKGVVEFVIDGRPHRMSAAEIGLHLDVDATIAAAHTVGRSDPPVLRPIFWLTSWFTPRRVPVTVKLDKVKLAEALAELPGQTPVTEPAVVGSVDAIGTSPGASGFGFDPDRVAHQIESVARDGTLPLRVPLVAETVEPSVSDAEVDLLAARARILTDRSIDLNIPGRSMTAGPSLLRNWITSRVVPASDHARLELDASRVVADVRQQLGIIVTRSRPATFTVQDSRVLLVPQVDGHRCCSMSSAKTIFAALETEQPSAELALIDHPPTFTTARARQLGITTLLGAGLPAGPQLIWKPDARTDPATRGSTTIPGSSPSTSSTTTMAPPRRPVATGPGTGQFVVTIPDLAGQAANVNRAIPLLRGRIIQPGAKLSLNDVIGAPSPERGFVAATVARADGPTWISGGGTDLVAAALFEAAYESGLNIPASTRHDVIPVGVRLGIEATLGWTGPDLVIENPSDHGILVWADRVGGGIRVQMFGTPFTTRVSTATAQNPFGPRRACLDVDVRRTRVFTDGSTETDRFTGRYTSPPEARDDPNRVICPS